MYASGIDGYEITAYLLGDSEAILYTSVDQTPGACPWSLTMRGSTPTDVDEIMGCSWAQKNRAWMAWKSHHAWLGTGKGKGGGEGGDTHKHDKPEKGILKWRWIIEEKDMCIVRWIWDWFTGSPLDNMRMHMPYRSVYRRASPYTYPSTPLLAQYCCISQTSSHKRVANRCVWGRGHAT